MTFGKRMQKTRKLRGFTQEELANKCGVVTGTIQQYELDKRRPKPDMLQKIAYFLHVQTDYLLHGNLSTIGDRIQYFREMQGLTQEELASETSIPLEKIIAYESDSQKPTEEDIILISKKVYAQPEHIEMALQEWIKGETKFDKINALFDSLNEKGKDTAIGQVELLTKIPEYQAKNE